MGGWVGVGIEVIEIGVVRGGYFGGAGLGGDNCLPKYLLNPNFH